MNKEKLVNILKDLKGARFGLDTENGIQVPKDRVLIEYDNDWHTLAGIINMMLEALLEEPPPNN